jgi:hypothetical protein
MSHSRLPLTAACVPLAIASGTVSFSPLCLAQDGVLEEVIVTARRRLESLQETPVAVTALSAAALSEACVRNLSDLNSITPNIEVASTNGTAPLANIYIRGVGQRNTDPNIDSGIGIYFDSASCRSGQWLEDEQLDISARLTWISTNDKWVGALYGTNLTEQDYMIGGSPLAESEALGGSANALPGMYGVELQYQF